MNASYKERIDDPCGEMARLAKSFLPLEKWRFTENYRSVEDRQLIYDSEWCRIMFIWEGWEPQFGNSMDILYGRLHAPNDKHIMTLNQQDCRCWHGLTNGEVLNFLDGLSPQEARYQKDFPQAIVDFRNSELWHNMAGTRREPELTTRMNAAIWEYYGLRLFELFDLRRPDLWEKYTRFMKEFYDIKGRRPNIDPPLDKVC